MKPSNLKNKPRAIAITQGLGATWERKLVLQRFRPPPEPWKWPEWKFWFGKLKLIPNLFRRPELYRQISPELPPMTEEQWKNERPQLRPYF
jgi:hypothetical protein